MKKINWFSRLFLSWEAIKEYIKNDLKKENKEIINNEVIVSKNEHIESLKKEIEEKKEEIYNLKNKINSLNWEKKSLKEKETENQKNIYKKNENIEHLKHMIQEKKNELENQWSKINNKLNPLEKIEKTFFASSGNKGKGELGEMQLKTLLEKSGLEKDFWIENLSVGKNTVEFAIRSGFEIKSEKENKWIPIDSKVLEHDVDENNKIVINEKYKQKVKNSAKEITKYLGKSNTTNYGLLVLQNDSIYMQLYERFPNFFKEIIQEYKIYITSPSSFIQFAWSISNIFDIYEKVHNDEKIYNQMLESLTTITKLSNSLIKVHKDFNIAMNTHYPTLQKRHEKLLKKLLKEGKIKNLPKID